MRMLALQNLIEAQASTMVNPKTFQAGISEEAQNAFVEVCQVTARLMGSCVIVSLCALLDLGPTLLVCAASNERGMLSDSGLDSLASHRCPCSQCYLVWVLSQPQFTADKVAAIVFTSTCRGALSRVPRAAALDLDSWHVVVSQAPR